VATLTPLEYIESCDNCFKEIRSFYGTEET
jgi:hypothetical protein